LTVFNMWSYMSMRQKIIGLMGIQMERMPGLNGLVHLNQLFGQPGEHLI